jgi:hypothetical protein
MWGYRLETKNRGQTERSQAETAPPLSSRPLLRLLAHIQQHAHTRQHHKQA